MRYEVECNEIKLDWIRLDWIGLLCFQLSILSPPLPHLPCLSCRIKYEGILNYIPTPSSSLSLALALSLSSHAPFVISLTSSLPHFSFSHSLLPLPPLILHSFFSSLSSTLFLFLFLSFSRLLPHRHYLILSTGK